MLFLLSTTGGTRCVVPANAVEVVLPLLQLSRTANLPAAVAGLFSRDGAVVPVLDLAQLLHKRDCRKVRSSRIVLVKRLDAQDPIGILAEELVGTVEIEESSFVTSPTQDERAEHLGAVLPAENGVTYWLDVNRLMQSVRGINFA